MDCLHETKKKIIIKARESHSRAFIYLSCGLAYMLFFLIFVFYKSFSLFPRDYFSHASYLYSTTTFLRTVKYSTNISLDILSIVYLL